MTRRLAAVRAKLLAHALTFPEAYEDFPWGESVAKVNKKVFVFLGIAVTKATGLTLAVKLPVSGAEALQLPFAEPSGYGMGKFGWVTAKFAAGQNPPLELLREWVEESYRAVAPRRLVAELEGR
jgi:predicted DNA-binding protein (MmcQ/YjbR family)